MPRANPTHTRVGQSWRALSPLRPHARASSASAGPKHGVECVVRRLELEQQLAHLLLAELVGRGPSVEGRRPLLYLLEPFEAPLQAQSVEATHHIREQRMHGVHRNHVHLERIHGGDEELRALCRGFCCLRIVGLGRRAHRVLDGGGHARDEQALARVRAVHIVRRHEALHVRNGLAKRGPDCLELRDELRARSLVLGGGHCIALKRLLELLCRLDDGEQVGGVLVVLALGLRRP
mmetsp:Transcript_2684/g.10728  ORF Transcript_2684/g.10728 Transcript_2684/m.10728 type:complete len:235 (-) Transcript_2684:117-821(-)